MTTATNLLTRFKAEVDENGAELILIQLHPTEECVGSYETASEWCRLNNVKYFNLTDSLVDSRNGKFLNGFMNTKLGIGHLNVYGHSVYGKRLAMTLLHERVEK